MFGFFSLKGSLEVFLVVVWGKGGIRINGEKSSKWSGENNGENSEKGRDLEEKRDS